MGYVLAVMVTVLAGIAFLGLWRTVVRWMLGHNRLWRRQLVLIGAESIYVLGAISTLVSPEFDRGLFGAMLAGSLLLLVPLLGANKLHTWLEPFLDGLDRGIENALRWR